MLIVVRSDPGLAEDAVQGVNTAVLSPVLLNYLAKAVVPAAHGRTVFLGFGEWHDGALVYQYSLNLHHQGAPVNNPEHLPCCRMPGAYSFTPKFREALSSPRIILAVYHLDAQIEIGFVYEVPL